jgi:predicted MPP superfamily phosphohydrolase
LGTGLYTWQVEPFWVQVVNRPMPLENLPAELVGKTLLQISDIHVGPNVSSEYLIRTFLEARDLAPDFVAVTGDFLSFATEAKQGELARVLRSVPRGQLGSVASLGNHDYGFGWRDMATANQVSRLAADAGLQVLRNDVSIIGGLQFVGLADYWSPEFGQQFGHSPREVMRTPAPDLMAEPGADAQATLRRLAPGLPTVVLSHNPDVQDLPIWDGVRGWVLAGHTHGGQVKPPFLPPPILPVHNKRYTSGAFDVGPGRMLYVNRGLGFLVQVRLNVRPELTLFTLERAPSPRA